MKAHSLTARVSFSLVLLVLSLALTTNAQHAPVLHEKRELSSRTRWRRSSQVHSEAIIPLRIGLVQNNLDYGFEELMAISHPESPRYGQYLTNEQINALFAPSSDAVSEVLSWLIDSGVNEADIVHSKNKGWLAVDIPANLFERLFLTDLHEYRHSRTGATRLGCEEYHVPGSIQGHIDYITPGIKLSAPIKNRSGAVDRQGGIAPRSKGPNEKAVRLPRDTITLPNDLTTCGYNITPACIRALYSIPRNKIADPSNSPGFYEQGQWYSQENLDAFFKHLAPYIPEGTAPIQQLIDGAEDPFPPNSSMSDQPEANIDLQVAFGLVYPTIPTIYQVDDTPHEKEYYHIDSLFNTFLDALDGSYCNYTAYGITGDSWIDPKYPDVTHPKHGYQGQLQCGIYTPTNVISISYGEAEVDIPKLYEKRQCNEFLKLGLQGHTIFVASGDYGVASFPEDDSPSGCLKSNETGYEDLKVFNSEYPNCPYVTVVGATMLYPNQTVNDVESAMHVNLTAAVGAPKRFYSRFSSSGGFSNYHKRPKYQDEALSTYFAEHDPKYPTYVANAAVSNVGENGGLYNRAGRGFPDVSANGAFILGVVDEIVGPHFGTSFSAPIWASVVTLLNQERSAAGKGPIGFINPTLYANPWALNDITNGSNPECDTHGFHAVKGWDPVTGLGTPNYPKLKKLFMSLP